MASPPAPVPLATSATITFPFLRLAPELRNRIYKHTFTDVKKTEFVPHALTQTNKQIRNECRAMYYASIECIEITLRTTAQYHRTMKWLDEEDWSMFPVLPDITLLTYSAEHHRDVAISCRREQINPAHEFSVQLARVQSTYRLSERYELRRATMDTYIKCLGFDPERFTLAGKAPHAFTQVARGAGGGELWSSRRIEYRADNLPLLTTFRTHAQKKQGAEWDQHDLRKVVGWFYLPIKCRERRI